MNINATLLGQMISFSIFVWFCLRYVWPPLVNAMKERQERISGGLQDAEQAAQDLELAKHKAGEILREAKMQAAQLIEQANKRVVQLIDESKEQARQESERIKLAAQSDIEQEANRAREALRAEVATLAVAGAERILGQTVNQQSHNAMLDKLVAEL